MQTVWNGGEQEFLYSNQRVLDHTGGGAWEPYSYRESSSQPQHSVLRHFPRIANPRASAAGLTLNDIQNSLQLILFRMHKYKQMGMPAAVTFPSFSFSPVPNSRPILLHSKFLFYKAELHGHGSSRISGGASADCTRNNNLTNWPILA